MFHQRKEGASLSFALGISAKLTFQLLSVNLLDDIYLLTYTKKNQKKERSDDCT